MPIYGNTVGGGIIPQTDWNQNDDTKRDYLKNKPDLSLKADTTTVRSVITQDSQEIFQGYLSADGTFTATTGANKQRTTDYIALERNKYYKLNISYSDNASLVPRAVCVYNNDITKTFSRAITISTTSMSKIQLTDNERYIRVNWSSTVDRLNIYQWQDGESGKEQKLSYVKRNNFDHATARKLQICFTFDGDYENNEAIHNVFVNHSAKHSFALIPQDTPFTNVPYEKYKEWEKDGVEILVHTSRIMNSTTFPNTDDGIAWLYEIDKRMRGYGFNINGVVGSSGTIDDAYIPTIKKLWKYASSLGNSAGAGQAVHTFDESPFKLFRYGLQTSTLEEMKSAVDTAISQNGLLWFYGHCKTGDEGGNLTTENIDALLTYIENQKIEVVTPNKAIQDFYITTWDDIESISSNMKDTDEKNFVVQEKETIFGNEYCVEACRNYLNKTYTADTFPLRYHINKGNEIWIDGISEAGLSDNNFSKENITINSKYTIDGTEYTVTGIGDFAFGIGNFANKSDEERDVILTCKGIMLPLTVTHLGDRAFARNTVTYSDGRRTKGSLEYIYGTDNVFDITGIGTFGNCCKVKTIYLPRLNNLVKQMFSSCTELTNVCLGDVTEIPEDAFKQCYRLTDITKSNNSQFDITSIGYRAFTRCLALKNFNFDVTKVRSVGEDAFWFSPYETDWQTMMNNGCTFGLRATKYQLWNNQEALTHKFNFTPCLNTNGKNYSFQQGYNGWHNIPLGNSTSLFFGASGCSWMSAAMAHNILSGQNLTPVQFNNLVANSKDSEKANDALPSNSSTTNNITFGSLVELPMETFQSIESIQGIYDGLAEGYIYDVLMTTRFEQGTWGIAGTHGMIIVGVDENGYLICIESNYAGPNYDEPISGLIHFDLFTWFTDKTYGNNYIYNWVNKLTYNPNYELKG